MASPGGRARYRQAAAGGGGRVTEGALCAGQGSGKVSWRNLAGLLGYLLAALWLTWPLAKDPLHLAWGSQSDLWSNLWLLWSVKQSLLSLHPSFHTVLVSFPTGDNLLHAFGHLLLPIFSIPFQLLLGLTGTYNFLLLAMLVANGTCTWLLVRRLGADLAPAWIAGLFFLIAQSITVQWMVGSLEMVPVFFLPLYVLLLIRLREGKRLSDVLLVGTVLVLAALTNWLFGGILGLFSLIYVCWHLHTPQGWDWRFLKRAAGAGLLAVVVLTPLAMPLMNKWELVSGEPMKIYTTDFSAQFIKRYEATWQGKKDVTSLDFEDLRPFRASMVLRSSADLSNFVFPKEQLKSPVEATPGLVLMITGLAALVLLGRRGWFWALVCLVFLLLSLGPVLIFGFPNFQPWQVNHPLPFYYLFNWVPGFSMFLRPGRLQVMTVLGLCVALGLGLSQVRTRGWLPSAWARGALLVLVGLAGLGELFLIMPRMGDRPLVNTRIPAYYHELARQPGLGAFIEVPFRPLGQNPYNSRYLYYQTAHGHPLFNNDTVRAVQLMRYSELLRKNRFLYALYALQSSSPSPVISFTPADLDRAIAMGFTTIIVHAGITDYEWVLQRGYDSRIMISPQVLSFLTGLLGPPLTCPDNTLVFDLRSRRFPPGCKPDDNLVCITRDYFRTIATQSGDRDDAPLIVEGGPYGPRQVAMPVPAELQNEPPLAMYLWVSAERIDSAVEAGSGCEVQIGVEYHDGAVVTRSWKTVHLPGDRTWTLVSVPFDDLSPPLPRRPGLVMDWILFRAATREFVQLRFNNLYLEYKSPVKNVI